MSEPAVVAELAGVRFRPVGFGALEREIDRVLSSPVPIPLTVGYVNPHVITTALDQRAVVEHLEECDQVCVDGTGVWLALRLWRNGIERLPAYRAADELLERGVLRGATALIGIEPELIERAGEGAAARYPAIEIVGLAHGFSTDEEIVAMLKPSQARVVLIGAGSPRSEQIALLARQTCPDALVFHVGGGTLNAWTDGRSHAPRILSTLGVDWLYRFVKEPHTRPRYRIGIPAFIRAVKAGPNSLTAQEDAHRTTRRSDAA